MIFSTRVHLASVAYAVVLPWLAGTLVWTAVQLTTRGRGAWLDAVLAGIQPPILGAVALAGVAFYAAGGRPYSDAEARRWIVAALTTLVAVASALVLDVLAGDSGGALLWAVLSGYVFLLPVFTGLALRPVRDSPPAGAAPASTA